jgi:DNA gyrase subunit B
LIERGYVYIAQPPLYKIQAGKQVRYAFNDQQKDLIVEELREAGFQQNIDIQRYKGLGEMNPEQLWETTLNPEFRTLKKITLEDAQEADRIFDILMGEDVLPRKKFIQTYARQVKNLDI